MNAEPKIIHYGLIGHPLGHSYSQAFFTKLFKEEKTAENYSNFDLDRLDSSALDALINGDSYLAGCNVTSPYKEAIVPFLASLSYEAAAAGAVNCLRIERTADGYRLHGYNTDIRGFGLATADMTDRLGSGQGALILGTGGAAKAAAVALDLRGVPHTFVSRTHRAPDTILYTDITPEIIADKPLIINATPAGMFPAVDTEPPFPYALLNNRCTVFDMIYNPAHTLFMQKAAAAGAEVRGGLEMLHVQALESLKIWRNN